MRVLVISDVHSNLAALDAVLADAGSWDVIWSLGDIVGYGPEPNECIARLSEHKHLAIAGNHDWAVLDKLDIEAFNHDARRAILWTRAQLNPLSLAYLQALPETLLEGDFTLAHGSPRSPIWEYLLSSAVAKVSFLHFSTLACLVGHTHVPVRFRDNPASGQCRVYASQEGEVFTLGQEREIINPGGIGQPRDGDPRAAYLLLDAEKRTFEHRRVAYDVAATQEKMRAADLPRRLIARLEFGW
jgi:diadenosine tetraphosphatase ApaH/serine/threonine PP2A family protein phosphatase